MRHAVTLAAGDNKVLVTACQVSLKSTAGFNTSTRGEQIFVLNKLRKYAYWRHYNKKVGNWPTQRPMQRKSFSKQPPYLREGWSYGVECRTPRKPITVLIHCLLLLKQYLSPFTRQSQYTF